MIDQNTKLITILGPTASGKTDLALDLAERHNGEIICADSRTIYREMDIGTAKPSAADQARVRHHLLDIRNPDETMSAAEFKELAELAIRDISNRGKVPFLVGGTGLYAYAVIYDYKFPAGPRTNEREKLEQLPLVELVARLLREDPERSTEIDLQNPRRVIRALETVGQPREKATQLPSNALLLALRPSQDELEQRIKLRTGAMLAGGLVDEVKRLVEKYGANLESLRSIDYAEIIDFLAKNISVEKCEELINLHTKQLVKRQLTWLKRNDEIRWLANSSEADVLVEQFLAH